jgi:hypothetical protein
MRQLADYRKIHGHCNVRINTAKTWRVFWVTNKEPLQVAEEEEILYDAVPWEPGEAGFRIDLRHRHLGRPFETSLPTTAKSTGTAMFESHGENTQLAGGFQGKDPLQVTEQEGSRP